VAQPLALDRVADSAASWLLTPRVTGDEASWFLTFRVAGGAAAWLLTFRVPHPRGVREGGRLEFHSSGLFVAAPSPSQYFYALRGHLLPVVILT
jgi:hypothetical protein